jgi:hypothetical protein
MTAPPMPLAAFLDRVRERVEEAGVFGPAEVREGRLVCHAKASAAPASYRLDLDGGRLWVSLVMADRWLSESIESDLVEHGDRLEDLLEEELVELGWDPREGQPGAAHGGPVRFEHFRSDDMLFTFRSPLPVSPEQAGSERAAETCAVWLLAYEACFRNLGDMNDSGSGE